MSRTTLSGTGVALALLVVLAASHEAHAVNVKRVLGTTGAAWALTAAVPLGGTRPVAGGSRALLAWRPAGCLPRHLGGVATPQLHEGQT